MDFAGTKRFEVRQELGRGGFGVVVQATDHELDVEVALKVLRRRDSDALARFKREFRTLVEIAHPNLVELYELHAHREHWFFSMELLPGADLRSQLGSGRNSEATLDLDHLPPTAEDPAPAPGAPLPVDRIRAWMRQLTTGLTALHRRGVLHGDVKPSNAMVTPDDRIVLLDFGLSEPLGGEGGGSVGTPAYMAPEQAPGRTGPIGPASDWYSLGVILYEALTGALPFPGGSRQQLEAKQHFDGPDPREAAPEAPADLAELCVGLLRRQPGERPAGPAILESLGVRRTGRAVAPGAGPFVGRATELARLAETWASVAPGSPHAVLVHGPSGIGKSALVGQFLRSQGREAVALHGRCYESEAVPFKALDGAVDDLREELEALDQAPTVPAGLLRAFPVLREVLPEPSLVPTRRNRAGRSEAAHGLRQLLCDLGPTVLAIDDLQWGDLDSVQLLTEVLQPPDAPPVLVLTTCRTGGLDNTAPYALREGLQGMVPMTELPLAPLSEKEARALAAARLGGAVELPEERVRALLEDASGHPFLLDELLRRAQAGSVPSGVDEVFAARVAALQPAARELLSVLALVGRPASQALLHALELPARDPSVLHALRALRLVRSRSGGDLECYHDRVRETVAAGLSEDRTRALHGRIARGLEATGAPVDQRLVHLVQAGERRGAASTALELADQATQALAFGEVARLLALVLELDPDRPRAPLLIRRGNALAKVGLGTEAAEAWLEAATLDEAAAPDLEREAASELMYAGRVNQGFTALDQVLRRVGLSLPRSTVGAVGMMLWQRLRLWWRGLGYTPRSADAVPPDLRERVRATRTASRSLGYADALKGASMQALHIRLALDSGEPTDVGQALLMEAAYRAVQGTPQRKMADHLLDRAHDVLAPVGDPYLDAIHQMTRGMVRYLTGRFESAAWHLEECEPALRRLTDHAVTGELNNAILLGATARLYRGDWGVVARRLPGRLREARELQNLQGTTWLETMRAQYVFLPQGRGEEALALCDEIELPWRPLPYSLTHWRIGTARAQALAWLGRTEDSAEEVRRHWSEVRRRGLLRVEVVRIHGSSRSAAAALSTGNARAAERFVRRLEKETAPWGRALAQLHRAGLGQLPWTEAVAVCEKAGLYAHADAARWRAGEAERAAEGMQRRGVYEPERICRLFAPALDD